MDSKSSNASARALAPGEPLDTEENVAVAPVAEPLAAAVEENKNNTAEDGSGTMIASTSAEKSIGFVFDEKRLTPLESKKAAEIATRYNVSPANAQTLAENLFNFNYSEAILPAIQYAELEERQELFNMLVEIAWCVQPKYLLPRLVQISYQLGNVRLEEKDFQRILDRRLLLAAVNKLNKHFVENRLSDGEALVANRAVYESVAEVVALLPSYNILAAHRQDFEEVVHKGSNGESLLHMALAKKNFAIVKSFFGLHQTEAEDAMHNWVLALRGERFVTVEKDDPQYHFSFYWTQVRICNAFFGRGDKTIEEIKEEIGEIMFDFLLCRVRDCAYVQFNWQMLQKIEEKFPGFCHPFNFVSEAAIVKNLEEMTDEDFPKVAEMHAKGFPVLLLTEQKFYNSRTETRPLFAGWDEFTADFVVDTLLAHNRDLFYRSDSFYNPLAWSHLGNFGGLDPFHVYHRIMDEVQDAYLNINLSVFNTPLIVLVANYHWTSDFRRCLQNGVDLDSRTMSLCRENEHVQRRGWYFIHFLFLEFAKHRLMEPEIAPYFDVEDAMLPADFKERQTIQNPAVQSDITGENALHAFFRHLIVGNDLFAAYKRWHVQVAYLRKLLGDSVFFHMADVPDNAGFTPANIFITRTQRIAAGSSVEEIRVSILNDLAQFEDALNAHRKEQFYPVMMKLLDRRGQYYQYFDPHVLKMAKDFM